MTRNEIIELCRRAILSEDTHAFEECVFTIANEYLKDEDKNMPPWTEREEYE